MINKITFTLIFLALILVNLTAQPLSFKDHDLGGLMNACLETSLKSIDDDPYQRASKIRFEVREGLDLPTLIQSLEIKSQSTLKLRRVGKSRYDANKQYYQYDQYFNSMKVEGGFVSIAVMDQNPIAFYPKLFSNVGLNSTIHISRDSLEIIIRKPVDTAELIIIPSYDNYNLVWEVSYFDTIETIVWIDAMNGVMLNKQVQRFNLQGCTYNYGVVDINDNTQNGVTTLESPDQSIQIFQGTSGDCDLVGDCNWDESSIPSTTDDNWDSSNIKACVQAMHVTSEVVSAFDCLGLQFDNVNVDCNSQGSAACALACSTMDDAYINIGSFSDGQTVATYDVVAHELTHVFLFEHLAYTDPTGNAALHEGIADIVGTYIEAKISGIDWIIGDDVTPLQFSLDRNLSKEACFDENTDSQHTNGLTFGHWYFLMSQGNEDLGIEAIGLDEAVNIILEALEIIGPNADYVEMSSAILEHIALAYGRCTNVFSSAISAWRTVCIEPNLPQELIGPESLSFDCVDSGNACALVNDGNLPSIFNYTVEPSCIQSPNGTTIPLVTVRSTIDPSCTWTYENVQVDACNDACPGVMPEVSFVCYGNGLGACALINGREPRNSRWDIFPKCVYTSLGQEINYTLVWKKDRSCQVMSSTILPDCSCQEPEIEMECSIFGEACLLIDGQAVPNEEWGIEGSSCVTSDEEGYYYYRIINREDPDCTFEGLVRKPDCNPKVVADRVNLIQRTNEDSSNLNSDPTVFPNPVADILTVKFDDDHTGVLELIDTQGQLISIINFEGSQKMIDVSNLDAGFYFIKINTHSNRPTVKRFVKL